MRSRRQINWRRFEGLQSQAAADSSKTNLFVGLSFDTISSTGPNGAIIHYKPEKATCAVIDPKAIYLCDSGAQFRHDELKLQLTIGTAQQIQRELYPSPNPHQNNPEHTRSF